MKYLVIVNLENRTDGFPEILWMYQRDNLRDAISTFNNLADEYNMRQTEPDMNRAVGYLDTTDGGVVKCSIELIEMKL